MFHRKPALFSNYESFLMVKLRSGGYNYDGNEITTENNKGNSRKKEN